MQPDQGAVNHGVIHPAAALGRGHQTGVPQDFQVVTEQVARQGRIGLQFAHALSAMGRQPVQQSQPDGIGHRCQQGGPFTYPVKTD